MLVVDLLSDGADEEVWPARGAVSEPLFAKQ